MPKKLPNPPYEIKNCGYLTPCWLWLGCKRKGYGLVNNPDYNGFSGKKMIQAHVFYYEKAKGKIPSGFLPDHLCKIRACVNYSHIELVTNVENIRRGSLPIINLQLAKQIRLLYENGVKQVDLSEKFNIAQATISQIINYKTWRN
jgi:hypothetical protein